MSLMLRLSQIGRMASAEVLSKLEARAGSAEQLISALKLQIAEIKAQKNNAIGNGELDSLKSENAALKAEIDGWKKKLVQAQVGNGRLIVAKPTDLQDESPSRQGNVVEETSKPDTAPAPKKADEKKPKKEKKQPAAPKNSEPEGPVDIGRLDLRVGHIKSAKKHPDADSLYVEEVDVGEEKCRTVISGLVKFIPEEEMQNRMAVILCNLKPSKMRGIMSEAMVMCASTPEAVEILSPPAGSKPGDPVLVDGYVRNPDAQLNPKKKIFEACAPDLSVNNTKEACYKGVRWTVNGAPVMSQSLVNVIVK